MPYPASAVGAPPIERRFDATARSILAYAAGIGAVSHLDDRGGLAALPFQCTSLEWPAIVASRAVLGDALTTGEAARAVHAVQDSTFHRPMRPGDALITSAQLIAAQRIAAGVLTTHKLTTTHADTGAAVFSTYSSAIYRGVALDGGARAIDAPAPFAVADARPTLDSAATTSRYVPPEAAHVYTECADIWNPIHTEQSVAQAAGLPGVILHGTATWAFAGLDLVKCYGDGDPQRLQRLAGRFTGMVFPGETLTIRHMRDAENSCIVHFDVRTSSGARAIDRGLALFAA